MELQLSFLFVEFSLILCAVLFQESAGLDSPSLSVASLLLPIKVKTPDLRLYGGKWRFMLLQNGPGISPSSSPLPSSEGRMSAGHLPLPAIPYNHFNVPSPSPVISPMSSSMENNEKTLPPLPSLTLPSPPPNQRCISVTCTEPLTYTPPGAPCGCVWPIEIRLLFSISLYTFFPLVSELAEEIAAAISLYRSQVRIMGADAVDQQLEKTTVLIKLVPLDENFKAATAFSIYTKFWKREISIKKSVFGVYEVLYVRYPGVMVNKSAMIKALKRNASSSTAPPSKTRLILESV